MEMGQYLIKMYNEASDKDKAIIVNYLESKIKEDSSYLSLYNALIGNIDNKNTKSNKDTKAIA